MPRSIRPKLNTGDYLVLVHSLTKFESDKLARVG